MTVFLTIGGLVPAYGGPSHSVPALARSLVNSGVNVELITCEDDSRAKPQAPGARLPAPRSPLPSPNFQLRTLPYHNRTTRWLPRTNDFAKILAARTYGFSDHGPPNSELRSSNSDLATIFHDTGLWLPTNHAVAWAARLLERPLIISPRGMLTDWAMKFRGLKKRLAWRIYQYRDLQSARVLHATSNDEAEGFRALRLSQPIAIIPNGVELPVEHSPLPHLRTPNRHPSHETEKHRRRRLLCLGRIHPKKGILNLIRSWAAIQNEVANSSASPDLWHVVIAGNGENDHVEELKAESRKLNIESNFEFLGPIEGQAKWDLYRSADLFVLPSHSENFGLVIAEALACGVPVITTKGTPWEELQTHRCGWWVDVGVDPLQKALCNALNTTDEERREMGERGRALIESKYTWPNVAEQMKSVYEWVLGTSPRPACVVS